MLNNLGRLVARKSVIDCGRLNAVVGRTTGLFPSSAVVPGGSHAWVAIWASTSMVTLMPWVSSLQSLGVQRREGTRAYTVVHLHKVNFSTASGVDVKRALEVISPIARFVEDAYKDFEGTYTRSLTSPNVCRRLTPTQSTQEDH